MCWFAPLCEPPQDMHYSGTALMFRQRSCMMFSQLERTTSLGAGWVCLGRKPFSVFQIGSGEALCCRDTGFYYVLWLFFGQE